MKTIAPLGSAPMRWPRRRRFLRRRTYPDFVARLNDDRLLVVEYRGADRLSNADSGMKKQIGELWAARNSGKGVYPMAQ